MLFINHKGFNLRIFGNREGVSTFNLTTLLEWN